jgi:hypothetical protein
VKCHVTRAREVVVWTHLTQYHGFIVPYGIGRVALETEKSMYCGLEAIVTVVLDSEEGV